MYCCPWVGGAAAGVPRMRHVDPSQELRRWAPDVSKPATSSNGALTLMGAQEDSQEGQPLASASGAQVAEEALQAEKLARHAAQKMMGEGLPAAPYTRF